MAQQITIADVAKEAGVSKQTVSKVLNDYPDVAIATRKRVQEVIDRLAYQPNALARNLSANQTRTLGVLSSQLSLYGPHSTFVAIDHHANMLGYRIIPYLLQTDNPVDIEHHLRVLMAQRPDAIICEVPRSWEQPIYIRDKDLLSQIPIITMEENLLGVTNVLDLQTQEASRLIVHHLFDEGYKHIGVISGPLHWQVAQRRFDGWSQALKEHGITPGEHCVAYGDWSAASGSRGMAQLIDQYPEIDAVFACNDQMALGALLVLHQRGISVPRDLGVVGFDDIPESEFLWPPLTTVHQPFDQYGDILVHRAIEMVKSNVKYGTFEAPEMTIIRPELVIRQSSNRSGA